MIDMKETIIEKTEIKYNIEKKIPQIIIIKIPKKILEIWDLDMKKSNPDQIITAIDTAEVNLLKENLKISGQQVKADLFIK